MRKFAEDLREGDCLLLSWCGEKVIERLEDHGGPFPYSHQLAVFTDGTSMTLEKGLDYEVKEATK